MKDFNDVIGQKAIVSYLKNAINTNTISHAYIFHGEDGMGKRMMAEAFAKAIFCEGEGEDACNTCIPCMQLNSGNHPDLCYVVPEKTSSIGVDDIRLQLNQSIQIKPYSSEKKVYIIENAHKMTEQAQNSLLKTLEEPPGYAVILLLADNTEQLLTTILSRCIVLDFKPVWSEQIKELLMREHQFPDYLASIAANFSGGNVGKAVKYATSNEFGEMKQNIIKLTSSLAELEAYEIVDRIKEIVPGKELVPDFLDFLMMWYRDVLVYKSTGMEDMLLFKEDDFEITKQASSMSYQGLDDCMSAIEDTKRKLLANVNYEVAIELMLLRIKEN